MILQYLIKIVYEQNINNTFLNLVLNTYIRRLTFFEILVLIVGFANNLLKMHSVIQKHQPKYYFLLSLSISSIIRGTSLLLIMEQPDEIWLDMLYTFPTLFWLTSLIIFMGHLGTCYLVIQKKDYNHINSLLYYVTPVLLIFYIYFLTKQNFLQSVLIIQFAIYILIIAGCLFFSYKLFLELEEDVWMVPFLMKMRRLINIISSLLFIRTIIFILMYSSYISLNLDIILVDILIGEVIPYATLIYYKIPIPRHQNEEQKKKQKEVEMKSIQEPLLS